MIFDKLFEIGKKACSEFGVSLYDVEIKNTKKGKILVFSIIRIGGIAIDDCSNVSKFIDEAIGLDSDLFKSSYFLEVSSPGIERNLRIPEHYASAINQEIKITYNESDGQKTTIIAVLKEVHPEKIVMEDDLRSFSIPVANIINANIHFIFKKEK